MTKAILVIGFVLTGFVFVYLLGASASHPTTQAQVSSISTERAYANLSYIGHGAKGDHVFITDYKGRTDIEVSADVYNVAQDLINKNYSQITLQLRIESGRAYVEQIIPHR